MPHPDGFRLRTASASDRAAVCAVVFPVLLEFGFEPEPEGIDADLKDLEASYFSRGGSFEVAEDREGAVVGCAGLYPLDSRTCELRKMYLLPQVRGRGLGRRLLERAIARAQALGYETVVLETASIFRDAIALYTKCGFLPYEPAHLPARCDRAYRLDLTGAIQWTRLESRASPG